MEKFKKVTSGFNYVYERVSSTVCEEIIVEMPPVSPNKRSVAAIAWQSEGEMSLYVTIASNPESEDAMWQPVNAGEEINGAVTAFKIVEGTFDGKIAIRVIMR